MRLAHLRSLAAVIGLALLLSMAYGEDFAPKCFKQSGSGVEFDPSCKEGQVMAKLKEEKYSVKVKGGDSIGNERVNITLNIGGCALNGKVANIDGDIVFIVKGLPFQPNYPATFEASNDGVKFLAGSTFSSVPKCVPSFSKIENSFITTLSVSLSKVISDLAIVIETAELYDPSLSSSDAAFGTGVTGWIFASIILAVVSFLASGAIYFIWKALSRKRKAQKQLEENTTPTAVAVQSKTAITGTSQTGTQSTKKVEQPEKKTEKPEKKDEQPEKKDEQPGKKDEQPGKKTEQPGKKTEQPTKPSEKKSEQSTKMSEKPKEEPKKEQDCAEKKEKKDENSQDKAKKKGDPVHAIPQEHKKMKSRDSAEHPVKRSVSLDHKQTKIPSVETAYETESAYDPKWEVPEYNPKWKDPEDSIELLLKTKRVKTAEPKHDTA